MSGFEQPVTGRFRVRFAIPPYPYGGFHLTFHAEGYRETEYATPPITDPKDFGDIEIRLKPKATRTPASEMGVRGRVMRAGKPVQSGWIALGLTSAKPMNVPNAYVMRNRTTDCPLLVVDEGPIRHGDYVLKAYRPGSRYAVVVYEPGHAPAIHGPLTIKEDDVLTEDVACMPGGSISGRVQNLPEALQGQLWAVAFARRGHRAESRVQPDASFHFCDLPPGDYGVKIGHEGVQDRDTEVPWPGQDKGPDYQATKAEMDAYLKASEAPADPWKRAKLVSVKAMETTAVVVDLPDELK